MEKRKISVFSLAVLLGVMTLAGCDDPVPPLDSNQPGTSVEEDTSTDVSNKKTYTVSYYLGDDLYHESEVEEGSKLTKPTDPSKAETDEYTYEFAGWFEPGQLTPWDFDTKTVEDHVELYADFNEVAKEFDLSIWVYGGSSTRYITEGEFNQVKEEVTAALPEKDIFFKYVADINNDGFNASVLNATSKPDVVISGSKMDKGDTASLTLHESYPKTKVGTGWFTNTTRYVGVLDTATHLADAEIFYNLMLDNGPDYFAFESASLALKVNQSTTLIPTLNEGDERKVAYVSSDETVVSVDVDGNVSALAEGQATISATLGLVTIEIDVNVIAASYKLVAFVYGATKSTEYISSEENAALKAEYLKLSNLTEDDIYWEYVTGVGNDDFNALVNSNIEQGLIVDVVVSGNKVDNGDEVSITLDATYGKERVGTGWFANTTRRVAITEACDANMEEAIKLYNLTKGVSPLYEGISLNSESESLVIGDTLQLTAISYGEVTWSSSNNEIASVDAGLVTAVAEGSATITATAASGATATCEVVISAAAIQAQYDLVVYVYLAASKSTYITETEFEAIKAAFTAEGAAGYGKNISWMTFTGGNQAALGEFISSAEAGAEADVIIARSGISTGKVIEGLIDDATYNALGASWTAETGNYCAICSSAYAEHITLATALIDLLKADKVA